MQLLEVRDMKYRIILLVMIIISLVACKPDTNKPEEKEYDWNNGVCSECGGELIYSATGNKEHYICEKCGKEYTFNKVMSKKEEK